MYYTCIRLNNFVTREGSDARRASTGMPINATLCRQPAFKSACTRRPRSLMYLCYQSGYIQRENIEDINCQISLDIQNMRRLLLYWGFGTSL